MIFTSNKNLVVGARNELRNEAYKLGANIVYIQDMKNTDAHGSLGTTNTKARYDTGWAICYCLRNCNGDTVFYKEIKRLMFGDNNG